MASVITMVQSTFLFIPKQKTDIHIDASQNNLGIDLPTYSNPQATNYLYISTLDGELNIQ